jgi:putative membrane protein
MKDEVVKSQGEPDPRLALAAERTLLAWVRTGLAMMGFGFVVAKFGLFLHEIAAVRGMPPRPSSGLSLWIGGLLMAFGVMVNVVAATQQVGLVRRVASGKPYRATAWSFGVVVALMMAGLGVALTAYLLVTSQ